MISCIFDQFCPQTPLLTSFNVFGVSGPLGRLLLLNSSELLQNPSRGAKDTNLRHRFLSSAGAGRSRALPVISDESIAKASAPYRGQNGQNREKRVSGSKHSHFPMSQKWAL